jgi:beta-glucosidase-like glycosyl hydrolase
VRFVQAGGDVLILPTLASTSQVHARLLLAMKKKEISAARLNESVRRVLEMKGVDPCSVVALKQKA